MTVAPCIAGIEQVVAPVRFVKRIVIGIMRAADGPASAVFLLEVGGDIVRQLPILPLADGDGGGAFILRHIVQKADVQCGLV